MDQTFIRIKTSTDGVFKAIDKDIRDTTYEERKNFYLTISKGQIVAILEKVGAFNKNDKKTLKEMWRGERFE